MIRHLAASTCLVLSWKSSLHNSWLLHLIRTLNRIVFTITGLEKIRDSSSRGHAWSWIEADQCPERRWSSLWYLRCYHGYSGGSGSDLFSRSRKVSSEGLVFSKLARDLEEITPVFKAFVTKSSVVDVYFLGVNGSSGSGWINVASGTGRSKVTLAVGFSFFIFHLDPA